MYRRNTTAKYAAAARGGQDPSDRSQTLPRGFGRSRSAVTGLQSSGAQQQQPRPVSEMTAAATTLPRGGRYTTTSTSGGAELRRQTAALGLSASGGLGHADARPAKRASSTVSMTSIGYKGQDTIRMGGGYDF